ncbi:major facilitator superfamily (MFS) benzoate transporter [Lacticaseibacillus paracasei]|nr:major facilitator superfamily (MFS) benzoate transporter [Lacticaseibacillus paracasei]
MAVKEKKRVQVKIDKDLADDTEAVLSELGLNPTTAINMFYKRIVANGALPFNGLKSIFETDFKRHSEPRLPSTAQINH